MIEMNAQARNLILLLFGTAIGIAAVSGTYLNYVRPVMFWFLLASAGVIVALAVTGMAADVARAREEEAREEAWEAGIVTDASPAVEPEHAHGHDHAHGSGRVGWVLLAPVLLLLLCAPPALGPDSPQGTVVQVAAPEVSAGEQYPPLPAGEAPAISLHDFQNRAVDDTAGTLDRNVTVTAYVTRRDGKTLLGRVMIWCCVADARPIEIELEGTPQLPPDRSWVTAVVRLVPGSATREREYRPLARLVTARPVPQPNPPYDY